MDKTDDSSTLGKRLRKARLAVGMTQAELAKRAGYAHQSGIGNIEQGGRDGSAKVATLARVLGVDAYWLETGDGEMTFTLTGLALDLAQNFSKLPRERQEGMADVIRAAIGAATPDAAVEAAAPQTAEMKRSGAARKVGGGSTAPRTPRSTSVKKQ